MNRQHKRALMRQQKNEQIVKSIENKVLKNAEQQLNDGRVEAMMMCFVLICHRELGFRRKRCLRLLKAIDALMAPWINGSVDLVTLREQVIEEVGINIYCH